MPKLQITLPDGTEQSHELAEDSITVGRISDNMIEISDASVSSHHAQLTASGKEYILTDLGSTNGTRINGRQIAEGEEHKLQGGDTIFFGNIETSYLSDSDSEQLPMPEEDEPAAVAAAASVPPADFSNASPFTTKKKKKDPVASAVYGLAGLALLVFLAAVASVMVLKVQ